MIEIHFSPQAKTDLADIKAYITTELENPQAAANVLKRIAKRIQGLADFPQMGAPLSAITSLESPYRYLLCGNYTAFYRYEENRVYIARILYGRRDFMRILFEDASDEE